MKAKKKYQKKYISLNEEKPLIDFDSLDIYKQPIKNIKPKIKPQISLSTNASTILNYVII